MTNPMTAGFGDLSRGVIYTVKRSSGCGRSGIWVFSGDLYSSVDNEEAGEAKVRLWSGQTVWMGMVPHRIDIYVHW